MDKYLWLFVPGFVVFVSCKQKQTSIILPDIKSPFSRQLLRKDTLLLVDSFYLVGIDTMTTKSSLFHQRFPFFHILNRLNKQIDSIKKLVSYGVPKQSNDDLEAMITLKEEKRTVNKEIDSLDTLLLSADSVKPIGYRAIYKVTVRKRNEFSVSDTVAYSLSLDLELSDWDRNIEKAIDSLAIGHHVLRGPFNIRNPMN